MVCSSRAMYEFRSFVTSLAEAACMRKGDMCYDTRCFRFITDINVGVLMAGMGKRWAALNVIAMALGRTD